MKAITDPEIIRDYFSRGIQSDFALAIGSAVRISGRPAARIVGIDLYTCVNFDGQRFRWPSFTLDDGQRRYGLTPIDQHGIVVWDEITGDIPKKLAVVKEMSGYVHTDIIGDAAQSSPHGALIVFKGAKSGFYAREIFGGDRPLSLTFKGTVVPRRIITLG